MLLTTSVRCHILHYKEFSFMCNKSEAHKHLPRRTSHKRDDLITEKEEKMFIEFAFGDCRLVTLFSLIVSVWMMKGLFLHRPNAGSICATINKKYGAWAVIFFLFCVRLLSNQMCLRWALQKISYTIAFFNKIRIPRAGRHILEISVNTQRRN